jgi:hypothetical protein
MDQLALHPGKQPPVSTGVCPESVSAVRKRGKSLDHARNPTTILQLSIPYPKTLCTRTDGSVNLTPCLPHFLVPTLVIPVLRPFNYLFLLSVFNSYFAPALSCFRRSLPNLPISLRVDPAHFLFHSSA